MSIKIGTVVQAKEQDDHVRKGNTYRVVDLCDDAFYIKCGGEKVLYNKANLFTQFKIIPEHLCPTCLSDAKMVGKEECSYCLYV